MRAFIQTLWSYYLFVSPPRYLDDKLAFIKEEIFEEFLTATITNSLALFLASDHMLLASELSLLRMSVVELSPHMSGVEH